MGCAVYSNMSFAVTNKANYEYFPPFKPYVNENMNKHLGGENYNIARSIAAGEGFANPFGEKTGPTAWMPPVFPVVLAGLLWVWDNDVIAVMTVVIVLQVFVLIGTGLLVLELTRQTTCRTGAVVALAVFVVLLLSDFHLCFQSIHDCWLVLLDIDILIAGLCWFRPLRSRQSATAWGLFGGGCALINPIVAATWGLLSALVGFRNRSYSRLGIAFAVAGLILAPWTVRNYLVFGQLIPIKSNLAYELYQSQCLQPDGLIQNTTFASHPYANAGRERRDYKVLGEREFVARRRAEFWKAVRADPLELFDRAAYRFLGATLWYTPFNRSEAAKRPTILWINRLIHPLPFLAVIVLLFTAIWEQLPWAQWMVIGIYLVYLLPYIGASYYERYALPLLGVKVLLVVWVLDRLLCFWPIGSGTLAVLSQQSGERRAPSETFC